MWALKFIWPLERGHGRGKGRGRVPVKPPILLGVFDPDLQPQCPQRSRLWSVGAGHVMTAPVTKSPHNRRGPGRHIPSRNGLQRSWVPRRKLRFNRRRQAQMANRIDEGRVKEVGEGQMSTDGCAGHVMNFSLARINLHGCGGVFCSRGHAHAPR